MLVVHFVSPEALQVLVPVQLVESSAFTKGWLQLPEPGAQAMQLVLHAEAQHTFVSGSQIPLEQSALAAHVSPGSVEAVDGVVAEHDGPVPAEREGDPSGARPSAPPSG